MENKEKDLGQKIIDGIKIFFLIITAPIWFPWKLLFVRKEGNKFKDVDSSTKVFRLVRSPITKPLKFVVFLLVIALEVLIVYKVRYSALTLPFTRRSVQTYYLGNNTRIEGITEEENDIIQSEYQKVFDYIDKWNLTEKNRMYVLLDSEAVKLSFKYIDAETITYILNKFNNDEVFRNDVNYFVANINQTLSRIIKEAPKDQLDRLQNFLGPITGITSLVMDYAEAVDILGTVFNWAVGEYQLKENSIHVSPNDLETSMRAGIDYSKGKSLNEVKNYWK